jgi:hypothetical protein
MNDLFPELEIEKKLSPFFDKKCRQCRYIYMKEYNDSKRFYYCERKQSRRTADGTIKIKARDNACELFEERRK